MPPSDSGVLTRDPLTGTDEPTGTWAVARYALSPGALVGGKFILVREIGRGSTGVVFEVNHNELGHRVAIKALHPHIAANPNVMWRFKREAQLTASLKHPNIVSVFDVGQQHDSVYFIVQEFLEGTNLRHVLQQRGALPPTEALDYVVPIMGALVAAHHKGIIHRDVKPENIFLTQTASGVVVPKLIDFGLAKMANEKSEFETQIGVVMGTPSYMSPEQAHGQKADARTDVWSLGVILFEALSGERPYQSDRRTTSLEQIRSGAPRLLSRVAPHLPAELIEIVQRALEPDLSRRFPSMLDFLSATLRFAENEIPSFPSRHALSIPPYLLTTAPGFVSDDAEPPSLRRRPISQSKMRAVRFPSTFPSDARVDVIAPPTEGSADMLAELALDTNALPSAVELAEQAISEQPTSTRIKGRMRLVQAVACRWMGRFVEAERYAQVAYRHLPKGSARWFAAIGNLIVVLAGRGESEFLKEPADDLMRAQANKSRAALGAQVQALGQSVASLMGAGQHAHAARAYDLSQTLAGSLAYDDIESRVWLDVAEAELALHSGDFLRFLNLTELVVESFTTRGDHRNACFYRASMGNAYQKLGAFARAERELRAAITTAERMKLGFLAPARTNLGFTLARLGRLREAAATVDDALQRCVEQSYGRYVPVCQLDLAEVMRLTGELIEAETYAQQALSSSASLPAVQASALAVLAGILLEQGRTVEALERSTQAMDVLDSLPSVEDREVLIRLAHVRALSANGLGAKANGYLEQARRRLQMQAALISDPRWLQTFLEEVPENRATRELTL